jgi:hypothetical protein
MALPTYYQGSATFLAGKTPVSDTKCSGMNVGASGQNFLAGSAGYISNAPGAPADVWTIGDVPFTLANVQTGFK